MMKIKNTMNIERYVDEVYAPESIEVLRDNFKEILRKFENISVFSQGKNWGYGCKSPVNSGGLLIDLSKCNKILFFDKDHGVITLEPGVTYGQLSTFLEENGDEWLAPVHGGGPHCSVVGNALERGYGITPYSDHFGAVITLKALLSNGEFYERTLEKMGLTHLDRLFKYGVGPYYEGLFTQSGVGIVTQLTIRLAKKPEYVEMFYFNILEESDLDNVILAIKKSKQELGTIVGGINLINRERCLSMSLNYPIDKIIDRGPIDEVQLALQAKKYKLTNWLVIGMMYGPKSVIAAAKKRVLSNFKEIKKRKFFYNKSNRGTYLKIGSIFKSLGFAEIQKLIKILDDAYLVLNGRPNNVALKLAYWKNLDRNLVHNEILSPSEDNCGLIWYAPLVEMKPDSVIRYINFVSEASVKFNFNSLITLTTVDDLVFDSTIPILFNKEDELDTKKAMDYYKYLLEEGRKLGFYPYRLNVETQKDLDFQNDKFGLKYVMKGRYGK
jgi:4-cresol dehydrogenase (hydroxylating)